MNLHVYSFLDVYNNYKLITMDLISSILETCVYVHNKQKSKKITWSEPLTTELSTWTSIEYDRKPYVYTYKHVESEENIENIENIIPSNTLHTIRRRPSYDYGLCNI